MKQLLSYIPYLSAIILSASPLILALLYFSKKVRSLTSNSKVKKQSNNEMNKQLDNLFDKLKCIKTEVLIRDEPLCRQKVQLMIEGGEKLLQVISDFDRTMSRFMNNGHLNPTCHEVIESYPGTNIDMKSEYIRLRDEYHPIEIDNTLTNDEKIPFMVEWWNKAHDVMIKGRITSTVFNEAVCTSRLVLRDECDQFMTNLNLHNVPMLIFSAGIGNVIETFLNHKHLLFDNVRIVSNFMNFDKEDILVGFQDTLIHTFNKFAKSIQDSEFYESICTKRTNVMVLGDSTGDPHMSDGLGSDANAIKIGYLNTNIEQLKEKYMEIYDIVLVSDETFVVPRLILDSVLVQ